MIKREPNALKRVLHVTEASGGGVLQVISQLSRHQHDAGAMVAIAIADRFDTPAPEELRERLGESEIIRLGGGSTLKNLWVIFAFVRSALVQSRFDVLHLHSSFAGFGGRLARMTVPRSEAIVVYSPHAFGFLRTDVRWPVRFLIHAAERLLCRISDGTIAISKSERDLALQLGPADKVRLLSNCLELPPESVPLQEPRLVANIGRLVPQKGPERFRNAADHFRDSARFVWIGGRTTGTQVPPMGPNVEVTGNLAQKYALELLGGASVHLFTSKWEGMPLALMESQAMGIPAIAWDCPGVADVIDDGVTGFIVNNETDMLGRLRQLLFDKTLMEKIANNARIARSRFSSEGYGERSFSVYRNLEMARRGRLNDLNREMTS